MSEGDATTPAPLPVRKTPTVKGGRRVRTLYVVGKYAFVPHPMFHGVWIRTDHSVVKVACSYPGCGSGIGVPCMGVRIRGGRLHQTGYTSSTHYYRRNAAKRVDFPIEASRELTLTIAK